MPPRDAACLLHGFEERQRLVSPQMDQEQEENGHTQQQQRLHHYPVGFWEEVRRRRETPGIEAATGSTAVSRRQRNKWTALFFGQVVALIAASVNVTSFTLENQFEVVAPTFQLFLMYIFLSLHLCFRLPPPTQPSRREENEENDNDRPEEPPIFEYRMPLFCCLRLRIPWYLYFFMSCLDVGAGILMLRSQQYTSLTSITLLSSLTIPSTMLFSKILLEKSFYAHHIMGVCLCVAGGCLTIWSDLEHKNNPDTSTAGHEGSVQNFQINIGDLMAILAALLYGLGDAVSEYSIKHIDRMEFLGMLGVFGMVLTGLQFPFQEREILSQLFSDPGANISAFLLMGGYVTLLLLYYVTEASFLVSSDATLLNLSLQAQNLWAILFSVLAYQTAPPLLFYLALVFVGIGVFAYEVGGPTSDRVPEVQRLSENQGIQEQNEATDRSGPRSKQGSAQYSSIQQIEIV